MSTQLPWEALGNNPTTGTLYGLNLPKPRKGIFVNRTGKTLVVGDICQIDVSNTDGTTTAWDQTTAGFTSNLIKPRANFILGREGGIVVAVTKLLNASTPGADNTDVEAVWYGPVDASVVDSSGALSFGEQLVVGQNYNLDGVKASGERVVAFCIEAAVSTTTKPNVSRVFLTNGYSGLEAPGGKAKLSGGLPV